MSDYQNLRKQASNLDSSLPFGAYSKVVIIAGTNDAGEPLVFESGDDSGETLSVENPFGSQEIADYILTKVRGYQYQPYNASGAMLDPAMQLGDAVSVNDVYSGIYKRETTFDSLMTADISAPVDEEIEHEYVIESSTDRAYQRTVKSLKSRISINATEIEAKVSKEDENEAETFGWSLQSNGWRVFDSSGDVLQADPTGLSVRGEIRATSGTIGNDNGFIISASSIHKGMNSFDDANNGVYIGTDGIALGGGKFKVSSSGALNATSANISGAITCTSLTVSGKTYSPSTVSGGISGGARLGAAITGEGTSNNNLKCNYLNVANSLRASTMTCNALVVSGHQARWRSITVGQSTWSVLAE